MKLRRPKMLLLALILGAPCPHAAATEPPAGVSEVRESGQILGWAVNPSPILKAKSKEERARLIDQASEWIIRQRFFRSDYNAGLKHQAASMSAFLADVVDPYYNETVRHYQVFVAYEGIQVLVNRFNKNGTISQMVGKFGLSLSGWQDFVNDPRPGEGLTVWFRGRVTALDDHKEPFIVLEHYGGKHISERLLESVSADYNLIQPTVSKHITVRRRILNPDGSVKSTVHIPKETVVVYRAQNLFAELVNTAANLSPVKLLMDAVAPDALPPVGWQPACGGIDLSAQYPDPPTRNQGSRGTCHIFTSIGLMESAINRAYELDIRLSEEDLAQTLRSQGINANPDNGGSFRVDVAAAQRFGVATRKTRPYPGERRPGPSPIEENMRREAKKIGIELDDSTVVEPVQGKEVKVDPAEERRIIRDALAGFELKYKEFGALASDEARKQVIIDNLCRRTPLAMGMNIRFLPEWDSDTSNPAWSNKTEDIEAIYEGHAVLIVGFEEYPKGSGSYRFKIRNSWGGDNPRLGEDQIWRIRRLGKLHAKTAKVPEELKKLAQESR